MKTLKLILISCFIGLLSVADIAAAGQSSDPIEVPIKLVRGDMIIALTIEGRAYDFVIDTGASNSLILESNRTKSLDTLRADGVIELLMPLTERTVDAALIREIDTTIAGQPLRMTNVAKLPWRETGLFSREANIFYDGILGSDLFDAFIVEFDRAGSLLRFHNKTLPIPGNNDLVSIPIKVDRGLAIASIDIVLDEGTLSRDILIDTGFPGSVNLYGLQNIDIAALTKRYGPHQGTGRKIEFKLGPCMFNGVRTVAFREPFGDFEAVNGVMGADFLEHFRFAVDYEREKLYLFGLDKQDCQARLTEE